eukprot:1596512-Amphidinium_carterae.1
MQASVVGQKVVRPPTSLPVFAVLHPLLRRSLLAEDGEPTTGPSRGSPSGNKGAEVAINEVVPHRQQPFSPAPAPGLASAHQGPRVFGFSDPDLGLPSLPVQPGRNNLGPAERRIAGPITATVDETPNGPAQPGLRNLAPNASSAVARRSPNPAERQCVHGTHTWERHDQGTPALPDVLHRPSARSNSICPKGGVDYPPPHKCSSAGRQSLCPSPWHAHVGQHKDQTPSKSATPTHVEGRAVPTQYYGG